MRVIYVWFVICYRNTAFKLWYLKDKDLVIQIDLLFLKDISAGEVQSLYKSYLKDAKWLSLLKDLFGTWLTFKIVLDLEEF